MNDGACNACPERWWSNERTIEFINLYKSEPCLWSRDGAPANKHRLAQLDAWRRILRALSFQATLFDVKTKRNSLMGYYRTHINNYRKALKCGEAYTTTWFAFEPLHSFLGPQYAADSHMNELERREERIVKTEETVNKRDRQRRYREKNREILKQKEAERRLRRANHRNIISPVNNDATTEKAKEMIALEKKRMRQKRYREQHREKLRQKQAERKKQKHLEATYAGEVDVRAWAKHTIFQSEGEQSGDCSSPMPSSSQAQSSSQMQISSTGTIKRSPSWQSDRSLTHTIHYEPPDDFANDSCSEKPSAPHSYDEYDHFGLMIASKIRKIDNFEERETVMNVIQNIVYQSVMRARGAADQPTKHEGPAETSGEPGAEEVLDVKTDIASISRCQ